jgi:hypothetical protein
VRESGDREAQSLRAVRNQCLFRLVNERIFDLDGKSPFTEYVCECPLRTCGAYMSLSAEEYLEIRHDPTQFVVFPGHWSGISERVVRTTDRYHVVEKTGESRVLAERSCAPHPDEA